MTKEEIIVRISNALPFFDTITHCVFDKGTEKFFRFLDFSEESNGFSLFDSRVGDCVFLFNEKESDLLPDSMSKWHYQRTDYYCLYACFFGYDSDSITEAIYQALKDNVFLTAKLTANKANIIRADFRSTQNDYLNRTSEGKLLKFTFSVKTTVPNQNINCLEFSDMENLFGSATFTHLGQFEECKLSSGITIMQAVKAGTHKIYQRQGDGAITIISKVFAIGDDIVWDKEISTGFSKITVEEPDEVRKYFKLQILPCQQLYQ